MATAPPRVGVSDLVTFAVLDELIRTFVDHGDLTGHEAASMLDRVIANVRAMNVDAGGKAISASTSAGRHRTVTESR